MRGLPMSFVLMLLAVLSGPLMALDLKSPPSGGIYDPGGALNQEYTTLIKNRIAYEKSHRQFELFVIIFEQEPSQGARVLAKQAGESWSDGEYWSVVYQVGAKGEPDCLVGGTIMGRLPKALQDVNVRGARNTALLVTTPQSRLEAIVNNLSDNFGFLYVRAKQRHEEEVKKLEVAYLAEKKRKENLVALGTVLAVMLVGLSVLGFVLWKKHLRKFKPMEFPVTSSRRRLAAPSSGGGSVLVKYSRKH
ncbi:hypothetical protein AAFN60_00410 [Roseibacillus persicicus]|uniref:hypothetical protein n=1 Tax=Roseibacillus persicicus TaxID=454148 RepID=UPI00398AB1C3